MAVTPLIKPIQDKKGILYNFQSALEDFHLSINNETTKTRFSKFALLRIPEIGEPNVLATDNKIQFLAQGETPLIEGLNADNNVNLAHSFQNYALNLEALLLSRPQYKREEKLTISERVFWKWLKEIGAIRYQNANSLEKNVAVLGAEKRFVEKPETNSTYKKVVKYIGDIDVVNSLRSKDNSYQEVYIHVPTNVGTTPHVMFKSVSDENYYPNMTIANNPRDPLNIEYLSDRDYNETHPFGLSMKAFYDLDDQSVTALIKDNVIDTYSTGNWFNKNVKNSYYTDAQLDPDTGTVLLDASGEPYYDVAEDQFISKQLDLISVEYVRSTLDGASLDFDLTNYKLASENQSIKVFAQFNDYVANRDFEFNAVLIYYDVFDPNNLDADGAPIDFKTNLYGVLFLDKIQQSGLEFQIPVITKYKPDPLNKTNGNAFSFKANLKMDTSVENVQVEKSINDYHTFSLDLFTDVLTQMKMLNTTYNDKILELDQLKQDVETLKDLLLNTEDQKELEIRIANLETSLEENSAIFSNTGQMMGLIESANDRINSIIDGTANVTVSYDTNAIRPGPGILIDRHIPNRTKIVNSNQSYNISDQSVSNIFSDNVLLLSQFTNYFAHFTNGDPIVLIRDMEVFIDDSDVTWKKGQTVRLVFEDEINLDIYNLKIFTDSQNRMNGGAYAVQVAVLDEDDFSDSNNTPIFDIVCMDETVLSFRVDKIR